MAKSFDAKRAGSRASAIDKLPEEKFRFIEKFLRLDVIAAGRTAKKRVAYENTQGVFEFRDPEVASKVEATILGVARKLDLAVGHKIEEVEGKLYLTFWVPGSKTTATDVSAAAEYV